MSHSTDIPLDLSLPIRSELTRQFDLVFNHTVLEHVRHPEAAFAAICAMSKNYVLTVVPFVQGLHFSPGNYGDYYRFSPMLMRALHSDNGFEVVREMVGPRRGSSVYIVTLGVRQGEGPNLESNLDPLESMNEVIGHRSTRTLIEGLCLSAFVNLTNRCSSVYNAFSARRRK